MMNIRILINMVCVAVLAVGLYLVKYSVQDVQREVAGMKTQLAAEKESLHLLNAEWAYLNRPDRLRQLANRHLEMAPLDSRNIGAIGALPVAASYSGSEPSTMVHQASAKQESR